MGIDGVCRLRQCARRAQSSHDGKRRGEMAFHRYLLRMWMMSDVQQ
jgi:hypothetical protein